MPCSVSGADCQAEGRYFTSDYPGILREVLSEREGGEVLFMNGALGVIIGPGGTEVWEVDEQHPLGTRWSRRRAPSRPGARTT